MTTRSQNNFLRTPFAAALLPLLVSACVVGPDYQAPAATTAQRITGQPLPAETVSTPVKGGESQKLVEGGVLPERWWTLFGSPAIDGWVDEAIRNSPSLAIAEATLRQAEANYRAATGAYYPSVTAGAGASRQKISGASAGGGFPGSIFNLYNASVTVSYALDLWGGVQRAVEGQGALVEAQRRQSQAAYLTLAGNVVTSAIALIYSDFGTERSTTRRPTGAIIAPAMPSRMRATTSCESPQPCSSSRARSDSRSPLRPRLTACCTSPPTWSTSPGMPTPTEPAAAPPPRSATTRAAVSMTPAAPGAVACSSWACTRTSARRSS